MARLVITVAHALAAALLVACTGVITVTSESPIEVEARPPSAPLPGLPPVPQPPPPPRVTLEGDVLTLDEALTFDEAGQLVLAEHQDILAEVADWLGEHPEVTVLSVEADSIGDGSRRVHNKRSAALATQIVDALVAAGVAADRLAAVGLGKSEDDQRHVSFRVTEQAETEAETEEGEQQ